MKKLSAFLLLASFISSSALAEEKVLEKKNKILGKEFSVKEILGTVPSGMGVTAETKVKFLGKAIQLLSSKLQYTTENGKIENKSNDLYVNGIKVWTGGGSLENNTLSYSGNVAPTQVNIPVVSYTVGPLVLEVNAGVEFEAAMDAKLSSPLLDPDLSTILSADELVDSSILTNATAKGYVEGRARVLIVQAGVGGAVNVLDGDAAISASVPLMDIAHPTVSYDGKLQVLNGNVYAFIDYRKLGGWKRYKDINLYKWNGYCFAMGEQSCEALN